MVWFLSYSSSPLPIIHLYYPVLPLKFLPCLDSSSVYINRQNIPSKTLLLPSDTALPYSVFRSFSSLKPRAAFQLPLLTCLLLMPLALPFLFFHCLLFFLRVSFGNTRPFPGFVYLQSTVTAHTLALAPIYNTFRSYLSARLLRFRDFRLRPNILPLDTYLRTKKKETGTETEGQRDIQNDLASNLITAFRLTERKKTFCDKPFQLSTWKLSTGSRGLDFSTSTLQ
jgi:hypothetical protein